MADFAVRFNDFTGGDWGDTDPAKAQSNQFSGKNVLVYGSGLLGVRAGWKLLDLTGKVAGGNPPNYTGVTRGFDLMRDHLTLVIDTKSYDIYWDLSLVGGSLPSQAPATLPGGLNPIAYAQLLYSQDPSGVKEWLLCDGTLHLKSSGATPAWAPLNTVGGATAPPNPLNFIARWGLYLVAAERTVPWRIRFSQVDASGPNFLIWPANNYLDMSTTDPITALRAIFNLLYVGKASGWFGVSGVLGTLASVRELAIGNGPIDHRASAVTTDNRVVYWPLQKNPAFWNGERVSLVDTQRMDPRTTWLDTTPVTVRTDATPDYPTATPPMIGPYTARVINELQLPDLMRQTAPAWAASGAKAGGSTVYLERRRNLPRYTSIQVPPGDSNIVLDQVITADNGFTANAGGDVFTVTNAGTYEFTSMVYLNTTHGVAGHYIAIVVNGTEQARCVPTTADMGGGYVYLAARVVLTAGQTVSLRAHNADTTNISIFNESMLSNQFSPYLRIAQVPAVAAGARWVCPSTGTYDLFAKVLPSGYSHMMVLLLRNGFTVAQANLIGGDPIVLDLPGVALNVNDEISLAVWTRDGSNLGQSGGIETDASPLLKMSNRATAQQVGVLGMFGSSVIVTPTEKLILMAGDDGGVTKVWRYSKSVWTHHELGVLIAGLAPSDVRMSYLLPEHVVFAAKRSYTAEALKVWSIHHDLDRPAFVSDQWASPYDQAMVAGNVLVKGQATLPMWFDGQGRQCRVRSVIVQFVKWNQGIAGGVNQISARVDSIGPYDRGVTPGTEATWSEPMTGAANTLEGTEDSWRFNVGEQGFGNGFQLVFTALYGVAIREAVVLVDLRTERT